MMIESFKFTYQVIALSIYGIVVSLLLWETVGDLLKKLKITLRPTSKPLQYKGL